MSIPAQYRLVVAWAEGKNGQCPCPPVRASGAAGFDTVFQGGSHLSREVLLTFRTGESRKRWKQTARKSICQFLAAARKIRHKGGAVIFSALGGGEGAGDEMGRTSGCGAILSRFAFVYGAIWWTALTVAQNRAQLAPKAPKSDAWAAPADQ